VLGFDYLLVDDPDRTDAENFDDRVALGQLIGRGGRTYGKTIALVDFDNIQEVLMRDGAEHVLAGYNTEKLKGRFEFIAKYVEEHPLFRLFHNEGKIDPVNRSLKTISLANGHITYGVIEGQKNPGDQFLGKHPEKTTFEEMQMFSSEAWMKHVDARSELGCIIRGSGVPDGRRDTPFHDMINDRNMTRIWYSSFVNPNYTKKRDAERAEFYGGRHTHGYRTNVLGQEGDVASGAWDMEDIEACENGKPIKLFEINKVNYPIFKADPDRVFIMSAPASMPLRVIATDIGRAPTECGIWAWQVKNEKWELIYRVKMNGLVHYQQAFVLDYLADFFNAATIGIDATDGLGLSVAVELIDENQTEFKGKKYYKRVQPINFSGNVEIGFERGEDGDIRFEKGEPIPIKQHIDEAMWKCGLAWFHEERLSLPIDDELKTQFQAELAVLGQTKYIFQSPLPNHVISMFKVFLRSVQVLEPDKTPTRRQQKPWLGAWLG